MEDQMMSSVDRRHKALSRHEDVENVEIDYDDGELVLRVLMPEMSDEFEAFVKDDLDLDVKQVSHVIFGLEVEMR